MPGEHTGYRFKLVDPAVHLILRFTHHIESDHILALCGDGLQTCLCTRILLEFYRIDLTFVRGKSGHPSGPQSSCADTNPIAHCVNLARVEEGATSNPILQSLITHPNLYDHQADGLIVLFELAGTTFETYAGRWVVGHCLKITTVADV